MSVNMFRLRLTIEAHPRVKNGQPPQRTTGVAKTSCTQVRRRAESACCIGWPGSISAIASSNSGAVRSRLLQAVGAAEGVRDAIVNLCSRCLVRVHGHAANWVLHSELLLCRCTALCQAITRDRSLASADVQAIPAA